MESGADTKGRLRHIAGGKPQRATHAEKAERRDGKARPAAHIISLV